MEYVYLIQSVSNPARRYIGVTNDLEKRLKKHNEGGSPYTSQYRPWRVVTYIGFGDERRAVEFERYLKTGSGRGFAEKRLW